MLSKENIEKLKQKKKQLLYEELVNFIKSSKNLIETRHRELYDKINKIKIFMAKYSLMQDDLYDIISDIQPSDPFRGPSKNHDKNRKDKVWEFKISKDDIRIKDYNLKKIFT